MRRLLAEVEHGGSQYSDSMHDASFDGLPGTLTAECPLLTSVPFLDMPTPTRRKSRGQLTVDHLEVGDTFENFELVEKLGHGSFGRVFIARQLDLAGRLVALKFSATPDTEKDSLARLQHTNIMPIFSAHRVGRVYAVCMPFFGRTTLADISKSVRKLPSLPGKGSHLVNTLVDRLSSSTFNSATEMPASVKEKDSASFKPLRGLHPLEHLCELNYVDAILHIGRGIASGLAHAHQSGLVHRDLKPANILLGDEGQPIILDFNLATEVFPKRGSGDPQGGTLAYMAPEQLRAHHGARIAADPRADIYSLGLIIQELLLGRTSHKSGVPNQRDQVAELLAVRSRAPGSLRKINPVISLSVEAIVHKCLHPDPKHRYQNADALIEDITRHQENRPLRWAGNPGLIEPIRKWCRRHPRFASPIGLSLFAATAMLVAIAAGSEIRYETRARDYRERYAAGHRELQAVNVLAEEGSMHLTLRGEDPRLIEKGRDLVRQSLARFEGLRNSQTDNGANRRVFDDATLLQVAETEEEIRFQLETTQSVSKSETPPEVLEFRREYLQAIGHFSRGRYAKAMPILRTLHQDDPTDASVCMMLGQSARYLGDPELAMTAFNAAISLRPGFAPAWLIRARIAQQLGQLPQADADLKKVLELDPASEEATVMRIEVLMSGEKFEDALKLADAFIAANEAKAVMFFLRAKIHEELGNASERVTDLILAKNHPCNDYVSLVFRANLVRNTDPKAALRDLEAAEKLAPERMAALQNQAYILADLQKQPKAALEVTQRLLKRHPDYLLGRCVEAVYLARSGQEAEALKRVDILKATVRTPDTRYRIACVYSLASKNEPAKASQALKLLVESVQKGFGWDRIRSDADLDPIRKLDGFKKLIEIDETFKKLKRPTD